MKNNSRIVTNTAAMLVEMYAGETVSGDALEATVNAEYALIGRRPTFGSYTNIVDLLVEAGVERINAYTDFVFPAR